MKTLLIIIIIITNSYVTASQTINGDSSKRLNIPKDGYNFKKCLLTIKAAKWQGAGITVTATIENRSKDTLRFGMWDYTWENFFVDNKALGIIGEGSDLSRNICQTITLLPFQQNTFNIQLFQRSKSTAFKGKFRICLELRILENEKIVMCEFLLQEDGSINKLPTDEIKRNTHLVWSNAVRIRVATSPTPLEHKSTGNTSL